MSENRPFPPGATANEALPGASYGSGGDAMSAAFSKTELSAAAALAGEVYGIAGEAARLSSERDETFLFTAADGTRYTLKIANPAEDPAALAFQDGALLHLAGHAPSVPVPRLVPTRAGATSHRLATGEGPRIVRLLTFLPGELQYRTPSSTAQSRHIGRALGELDLGLSGYAGRPPAGKLMWDISHTLDLAAVVDSVAPERQARVEAALEEFLRMLPAFSALERRQIIHNDFNPHNILVDPAAPERVAGIIDFGDMVEAPLVNDLAVAISYHLFTPDWAERAGAFLEGYLSARPLLPAEAAMLPTLIRARLAMSIIIAEWRSARFPENRSYIMRNHAAAWAGLHNISDLTPAGLKRLAPHLAEA